MTEKTEINSKIGDFNRATGLLVIEVVNSNPNGDPDRESDPRQRPNGIGEISPVSFKRKLRDILEDKTNPFIAGLDSKFRNGDVLSENYSILESRGRNRDTITAELNEGRTGEDKKFDQDAFLNSKFVRKYWDARVFGNTFLEEGGDKGFIKTGAVQFGVGTSISPVNIIRNTNTQKAGVEADKNQGMAPLGFRIVEHGVYCMPFFVNPNLASKSGCTSDDIELLKLLIPYAYDLTRSAIRPDVRIRHAWYVEHTNKLGSCPDYKIIEALTPKRKGNSADPSVNWNDYEDATKLPDELNGKVKGIVDLI